MPNKIQFPNNFNSSEWVRQGVAVTADVEGDADLIYGTSGSTCRLYNANGAGNWTKEAGRYYRYSVEIKAAGCNFVYMMLSPSGGGHTQHFDVGSGLLGSESYGVTSRGMDDLGSGWYRIWLITVDPNTSWGTAAVRFGLADSASSTSFTPSGTNGVLVRNMRIELAGESDFDQHRGIVFDDLPTQFSSFGERGGVFSGTGHVAAELGNTFYSSGAMASYPDGPHGYYMYQPSYWGNVSGLPATHTVEAIVWRAVTNDFAEGTAVVGRGTFNTATAGALGYLIRKSAGVMQIGVAKEGVFTWADAGAGLSPLDPMHVAWVLDGTDIRGYVNGVEKLVVPASGFTPSGTTYAGIKQGGGYANPLNWDRYAMYPTALSPTRINEHYNATTFAAGGDTSPPSAPTSLSAVTFLF